MQLIICHAVLPPYWTEPHAEQAASLSSSQLTLHCLLVWSTKAARRAAAPHLPHRRSWESAVEKKHKDRLTDTWFVLWRVDGSSCGSCWSRRAPRSTAETQNSKWVNAGDTHKHLSLVVHAQYITNCCRWRWRGIILSVKADFRQHFIYAGMFLHTSYTAAQKRYRCGLANIAALRCKRHRHPPKKKVWVERNGKCEIICLTLQRRPR